MAFYTGDSNRGLFYAGLLYLEYMGIVVRKITQIAYSNDKKILQHSKLCDNAIGNFDDVTIGLAQEFFAGYFYEIIS